MLILDFPYSRTEKNNSLFKPPCLLHFVLAAQTKKEALFVYIHCFSTYKELRYLKKGDKSKFYYSKLNIHNNI